VGIKLLLSVFATAGRMCISFMPERRASYAPTISLYAPTISFYAPTHKISLLGRKQNQIYVYRRGQAPELAGISSVACDEDYYEDKVDKTLSKHEKQAAPAPSKW
jgi:hypothetical protein